MAAGIILRPVLYVEDEENDAFLLQMGFQRAGVEHPLKVVRDGQEAIDYLSQTRTQHFLPCLVLLDLNLPRMSGLEVLEWLRQRPPFRDLPVVIFTSSEHQSDRTRARELGADDYVVKPSQVHRVTELVQKLNERWLKSCTPAGAHH